MDASVNTKHHGEFWSKMKPLLPGKTKTKTKIVLLENDNYITNSLSVAESFNEYFCEIAVSKGDALVVDDKSSKYSSYCWWWYSANGI